MARWLVGTSGYVYRDWRTRFYPALPVRAWLPCLIELLEARTGRRRAA
jgi:hypothetical protein